MPQHTKDGPDNEGQEPQDADEQDEGGPSWLDELPEAPGRLFYAVGQATYADEQAMRMAFPQAQGDATLNLTRRALSLLREELREYLSTLHEASPDREGLGELIEELSRPLEEVPMLLLSTLVIDVYTEQVEDESGVYYMLVAVQVKPLYEKLKKRAQKTLAEAEVEVTDEERAAFERSLAKMLGLAEEEENAEDENAEEEGEDEADEASD